MAFYILLVLRGSFFNQRKFSRDRLWGNYLFENFRCLEQEILEDLPISTFSLQTETAFGGTHGGRICLTRGNPVVDCLWMDENWIGQIMHLAKKTHSRRTHASTLFRYCAGLSRLLCFFLSCLLFEGLKAALREGMKILVRASVLPFVGTSVFHDMTCG